MTKANVTRVKLNNNNKFLFAGLVQYIYIFLSKRLKKNVILIFFTHFYVFFPFVYTNKWGIREVLCIHILGEGGMKLKSHRFHMKITPASVCNEKLF